MTDHERLRTARLSLCRPEFGDVDAILEVHRDPRACAHNPSDALADRAGAEALFARWDEHWTRHGFGYWVVRRAAASTVLGFCGLKIMTWHERPILNLLYRLAPSTWGDGVGTEVATAAVEWARAHRPALSVVARVRPANVASARVATKAGLVRAPELDGPGEDGHDLVFASPWGASPDG
ncbi:RimJ/RimL family protein N-acetyltransferase [Herbihabitans rhizosphaerae]|uniref:RimJ/RimL family protein N-acetyltransferase n=1 Tax=Herbihabitans rhizosphaerae TaxID=1872711 RepID=A0A4Q7KIK6_9PSEU|nr:GNAT family N-acetyltransferase [Herbihabitans rhizosphaerae]RZS34045.1 RimJ/RimL family protein N-acetyltransferase [Herbihabitans rhizosphaerae]